MADVETAEVVTVEETEAPVTEAKGKRGRGGKRGTSRTRATRGTRSSEASDDATKTEQSPTKKSPVKVDPVHDVESDGDSQNVNGEPEVVEVSQDATNEEDEPMEETAEGDAVIADLGDETTEATSQMDQSGDSTAETAAVTVEADNDMEDADADAETEEVVDLTEEGGAEKEAEKEEEKPKLTPEEKAQRARDARAKLNAGTPYQNDLRVDRSNHYIVRRVLCGPLNMEDLGNEALYLQMNKTLHVGIQMSKKKDTGTMLGTVSLEFENEEEAITAAELLKVALPDAMVHPTEGHEYGSLKRITPLQIINDALGKQDETVTPKKDYVLSLCDLPSEVSEEKIKETIPSATNIFRPKCYISDTPKRYAYVTFEGETQFKEWLDSKVVIEGHAYHLKQMQHLPRIINVVNSAEQLASMVKGVARPEQQTRAKSLRGQLSSYVNWVYAEPDLKTRCHKAMNMLKNLLLRKVKPLRRTTGPGSAAKTLCRFFKSPAGCREGNKCWMLHTSAPASKKTTAPASPLTDNDKAQRVCRFYNRSIGCKEGEECKFRHTLDSTAVKRKSGGGDGDESVDAKRAKVGKPVIARSAKAAENRAASAAQSFKRPGDGGGRSRTMSQQSAGARGPRSSGARGSGSPRGRGGFSRGGMGGRGSRNQGPSPRRNTDTVPYGRNYNDRAGRRDDYYQQGDMGHRGSHVEPLMGGGGYSSEGGASMGGGYSGGGGGGGSSGGGSSDLSSVKKAMGFLMSLNTLMRKDERQSPPRRSGSPSFGSFRF